MTNTYHDLPDVEAHHASQHLNTGTRWDKVKQAYAPIPMYAQPEGQGAGCIYSTAGSYAKWIRSLMHRSAPLSADAHDALVTPRTIIPVTAAEEIPFSSTPLYAFEFIVEYYRGCKVIGHDGAVPGFKTLVRYLARV